MSGVGFTYPFAKRVSSATKWVEGQRGILEPEEPTAIDANKEILVRTTTTFPPGYTGAMAAQAEIVDRAEDGSIIASMPVWVKDINGGTLSPNTIYQARIGGTYTQDITVNGIVTPTTLGLYLVQQAIKEIEPHFYPEPISVDNQLAYNPPGWYGVYFPFGWLYGGNVVISTLGQTFSNIVRSNSNWSGIINPYLKIRRTNSSITFPNTLRYIIFDYYSDPIWVGEPLTITSGKAGTANAFFNTPVLDPGGIATAGGPGKYLCQWQMLSQQAQYYSYSNFVDFLTVVSKVPTPTTSGISTGIGSGISGV